MAQQFGVVDEVTARLLGFCPKGKGRDWWERNGWAVRSIVTDYQPTTARQAGDLLSALTRFWIWAEHEGHQDLRTALTPANVERYANTLPTNGARRTIRSQLQAIGRATSPGIWPLTPLHHATSATPAPYTPAELAAHHQAAASTRRPAVRHTYLTALVFSVGIGAKSGAIQRLTVDDIERDGDIVWVHDPARNRPLPTRGIWARLCVELLDGVAGSDPILGPASRLNNNMQRCVITTTGERFSVGRGRSTWIVQLLDAGLPLDVVLEAAGLETPSGLDGYLDHMTPTPDPSGLLAAALESFGPV